MHSAASPNLHPDETRFVEMVFPEQANHYGTLFGGHALSLMGKAAFVTATRHARQSVVMATSDRIEFHEPVHRRTHRTRCPGRTRRPQLYDGRGRHDPRRPDHGQAEIRGARNVRDGRGE
jgi:acyl-coenzyme A thioesterase PaaI-like protein